MKKIKKLGALALIGALIVMMASCKKKTYVVNFVSDGGTVMLAGEEITSVTMTVGQEFSLSSLSVTKEGHEFIGWAIDQGMMESYDLPTVSSAMTLYANWKTLTYALTFVVGGVTVKTATVAWGEGYTAYPEVTLKDDEEITWSPATLPSVKSDVTVTGTVSKKTYAITLELGAGVATLSGETITSVAVPLGETFDLATLALSCEGHDFSGWYADAALTTKLSSTIVSGEQTVHAAWTRQTHVVTFVVAGETVGTANVLHGDGCTSYPTVTLAEGEVITWDPVALDAVTADVVVTGTISLKILTVSFIADGTTVEDVTVSYGGSVTKTPEVPEVVGKVGAWEEKDLTHITTDLTVNAVYTTKMLTVTFLSGTDVLATEEVPYGGNVTNIPALAEDLETIEYWDTTAFFNVKADTTVTLHAAKRTDVIASANDQNTLIVETLSSISKRMVVFDGYTYDFSGNYSALAALSMTAGLATVSNDLKLTTKGTGDVYLTLSTKTGNTITRWVKVMPALTTFTLGKNFANYLATTTDLASTSYLNKIASVYCAGTMNDFVFDLDCSDSNAVTLVNPLVTYHFTDATTGEALKTITVSEDGIKFPTTLEGKTVTISIAPLYAPSTDDKTLLFTVLVNDGMNVYTDADMKSAFANLLLSTINLCASFSATLAANQYNADGSIKNCYDPVAYTDAANVYTRATNSVSDNTLQVNGNYHVIDGSKLPHAVGNDIEGQAPWDEQISGQKYKTAAMQVAIFEVWLKNTTANADGTYGNIVSFNNMAVYGNFETVNSNLGSLTEDEIKAIMEKTTANSGSYIAYKACFATLKLDNVIAAYCNDSHVNAYQAISDFNYVNFYANWGSGIYSWAPGRISIKNSVIKNCGSAALYFDDADAEMSGSHDPVLELDDATVIDNYVSGSESWFVAYSMGTIATSAKSTLESSLGSLSSSTRTILKTFTNSEGVSTEMFNFAIFCRPQATIPDSEASTKGCQFNLTIGTQNTYHPFNFLTTDARAIAMGGSYMMPFGYDTDGSLFASTVASYMGMGLDQTTAVTYALASPYSATLDAVSDRYLEVILPVAGVGTVTFITTYTHVS